MLYEVVKREIAAAVIAAAIPKLDCYAYAPARPSTPCFFTSEITIEPNVTFGGCDMAEITCPVLVGTADDADGQLLLDRYLSRTGAYSIRAALLAARGAPGVLALNGAAADLKVVRIGGYRQMDFGDNSYFGADIVVQVIGD